MHDFAIISNPLSYTNPYFMLNIKVGRFFVMPVGSQRFVVTKIFHKNPLKEEMGLYDRRYIHIVISKSSHVYSFLLNNI